MKHELTVEIQQQRLGLSRGPHQVCKARQRIRRLGKARGLPGLNLRHHGLMVVEREPPLPGGQRHHQAAGEVRLHEESGRLGANARRTHEAFEGLRTHGLEPDRPFQPRVRRHKQRGFSAGRRLDDGLSSNGCQLTKTAALSPVEDQHAGHHRQTEQDQQPQHGARPPLGPRRWRTRGRRPPALRRPAPAWSRQQGAPPIPWRSCCG